MDSVRFWHFDRAQLTFLPMSVLLLLSCASIDRGDNRARTDCHYSDRLNVKIMLTSLLVRCVSDVSTRVKTVDDPVDLLASSLIAAARPKGLSLMQSSSAAIV